MTLISAYQPLPVSFDHGEGVWLWDKQGNKYLDALCGIAVCGLGHAHPKVTQAICTQAKKLLHTSNTYQIDKEIQLAEKLTQATGMKQAFFANSGAEANEAAIKLARLYGHKGGLTQPTIIVMENAFHGRTMATLTASGSRRVQAGFEPLVPGFIRAPFDDLSALETIAKHNDEIVAVMLEPIQGESGIRIPAYNYLEQIHDLCQRHNWLLILDEIQTGMGRTGKLFCFQHTSIQPDVLTSAKGLANGVPIGACLMGERAADLFMPGNHGSTFGGNPLACQAAITTLEVIEQEQLYTNAREMGTYLIQKLQDTLGQKPNVKEIRGKGLMIGIELTHDGKKILEIAQQQGLLIGLAGGGTVIRLLPALILKRYEADLIIERLVQSFQAYETFIKQRAI